MKNCWVKIGENFWFVSNPIGINLLRMAVFEIKWQADASLLSKMFLLKKVEEQLNLIDVSEFQEEILVRKIKILVQVFKGISFSKREAKAKLNHKRKELEMTIEVDFDEISATDDELDTYGLFAEAILVGIVDLIYVDGFDNFELSSAAEYVLFPE